MNKLIAFAVLSVLIFIAIYLYDKKYRDITDVRTYEDVEKLAEFDGDFEYREDGFYVILEDSRRFINWSEIIKITTKRFRYGRGSNSVYYIQTDNELFEIDTKKSGFYKFDIKIKENLEVTSNSQFGFSNINIDGLIFERSSDYAN